jgi:hypothetical protein
MPYPSGHHLIYFIILYNKTNLLHQFPKIYFGMKYYMFRTVLVAISRSLYTVQTAKVYVIEVCTQPSSSNMMEKKSHNQVSLHAYKSGTPKYRVRAKLKCSYWHINWCNGLFFFYVCDIGQNTKIINWKSWNFVCAFLMFYSFNHVWMKYHIKILPCRCYIAAVQL